MCQVANFQLQSSGTMFENQWSDRLRNINRQQDAEVATVTPRLVQAETQHE